MKTKLLYIFSILFLVATLFLQPSTLHAQGTYDCTWTGTDCVVFRNNCDPNLNAEPGTICDERESQCVPNSAVCNACNDATGQTCLLPNPNPPANQMYKCEAGQCVSCNPNIPGGQDCTLTACDPTICNLDEPVTWIWDGERCVISNDRSGYTTEIACLNANAGTTPVNTNRSTCNTATNQPDPNGDGIDTALGCIPYEPVGLTRFFLTWALGIGGGIALLMIGYASIIIMTSSGDPKKTQGGKELLTAAVSGLLLIIFSTFILRFFGDTLLNIF